MFAKHVYAGSTPVVTSISSSTSTLNNKDSLLWTADLLSLHFHTPSMAEVIVLRRESLLLVAEEWSDHERLTNRWREL
jgi:hypothetical protein